MESGKRRYIAYLWGDNDNSPGSVEQRGGAGVPGKLVKLLVVAAGRVEAVDHQAQVRDGQLHRRQEDD